MDRLTSLGLVIAASALHGALAQAQACTPSWLPTFGVSPGTNGEVHALATFDDGSGPALYAGGVFTTAGGVVVNRIAKWDGSTWSALGTGIDGEVRALTVFDDGTGSALYAGGGFTTAGGVPASDIAKWNGTSWSALTGTQTGIVLALTVYDDGGGGGPALYVGGALPGGVVRWDGSTWSPLGSGVSAPLASGYVAALTVFDSGPGGSGPQLIAGGNIQTAGGAPAENIASWNGSSWSALGTGVSGTVQCLTTFDDGPGGSNPVLVAGSTNVAQWNGSTWSALGGPFLSAVEDVIGFDDGSGPALYATDHVQVTRWSGSSWIPLASGMNGPLRALAVLDDGPGGSAPALYAGGQFTTASGALANHVARWTGASWTALGGGMNGSVFALTVFDDGPGGSGPALVAGGSFTTAGGVPVERIAKWDGTDWSALGSGMDNSVLALTVFDDGGGPALYAGGYFSTAGGVSARTVAKWDGASWSPLGSGTNTQVHALAEYDDGTGAALYVGGFFGIAGGMPANSIAKWNGSAWSPLGSGVNGAVYALAVHDDGSGPALHVGGAFTTAGGAPAQHVAKWNGTSWSVLTGGANNTVRALTVFDDGSGPALYAGGEFTSANGIAASGAARWDGAAWSPLGSGVSGGFTPIVFALTVFDDGLGPALYAGGDFTAAGGNPARRIARWNGTSWSRLERGVSDDTRALVVFDEGYGPALFAGGEFSTAFDSADSFLARWGCPAQPGFATCFGDGTQATACPCANSGGPGRGCAHSANPAGALLTADGPIPTDEVVLHGTGMPATVSAIYLKGDQDNGTGIVFGDGVRCADGVLVRLRTKQNVGGASQFPDSTDTITLSARGGTPPGSGLTGHYQVYFRNAAPLFCPPETFNVSNGWRITW